MQEKGKGTADRITIRSCTLSPSLGLMSFRGGSFLPRKEKKDVHRDISVSYEGKESSAEVLSENFIDEACEVFSA